MNKIFLKTLGKLACALLLSNQVFAVTVTPGSSLEVYFSSADLTSSATSDPDGSVSVSFNLGTDFFDPSGFSSIYFYESYGSQIGGGSPIMPSTTPQSDISIGGCCNPNLWRDLNGVIELNMGTIGVSINVVSVDLSFVTGSRLYSATLDPTRPIPTPLPNTSLLFASSLVGLVGLYKRKLRKSI